MNEIIHIACACDERYFPGLLGTLSSALVNIKYRTGCTFNIHIIDGGIEPNSWVLLVDSLTKLADVELTRYLPNIKLFENFPEFFYSSKMAYARLLLPKLLPIDKVIYLDTDILFLKDLTDLWNFPLNSKSSAVALEACLPRLKDDCPHCELLNLDPDAPYFNSGIMLMDLNRFRSKKIAEKTIEYLHSYPEACKFWDQSALNVTLYNDFELLDQSWNTQSHRHTFKLEERLNDLAEFKINYHFVTSYKPWLKYNDSLPNRLFNVMLDEIGYKLTDSDFLESKKIYLSKKKVGMLLPFFFQVRSIIKQLVERSGVSDKKTAEFWKERLSIMKFQEKKKEAIDKMEKAWRKKIQEAQQNQKVII